MQTITLTIWEQAALLGFSQTVKTFSNSIQAGAAILFAHRNKTSHVQREQKCEQSVPEVSSFCPEAMTAGTEELPWLDESTF